MQLESRTWDEWPRVTTVYHLPLLPSKVVFILHSIAVPNDRGHLHNPLQLSQQQLLHRTVVHSSLTAHHPPLPSSSSLSTSRPLADEDPSLFHSTTSPSPSSTPLSPTYSSTCPPPFLCVYSAFDVHCRVWPVQSMAEEWVSRELTSVWMTVMRLTWCWQDRWRGEGVTVEGMWAKEVAEAEAERGGGVMQVGGVGGPGEVGTWEDEVRRLESGAGSGGEGGGRRGGGRIGVRFGREEGGGEDGARNRGAAKRVADVVNKFKLKARL